MNDDLNYLESNLTLNQKETLDDIAFFLAAGSIAFNIIIIFLYWFFKDLRKFHFEVIVWLSVNYCFSNSLYFMSSKNVISCCLQAYLITAFKIASIIWSILIIYTAIKSIILRVEDFEGKHLKYRIIYFFITYSFSTLITIPIIYSKAYSDMGSWCWLYSKIKPGISLKLIYLYYFILWYLIFICFYLVKQLINSLNLMSQYVNTFKHERMIKIYYGVKIYPLVISICLVPGTINRLFESLYWETYFSIALIQVIVECSEGILVALVFLNTPYLKEAIKICINRICDCGKNDRSKFQREQIHTLKYRKSAITYSRGSDNIFVDSNIEDENNKKLYNDGLFEIKENPNFECTFSDKESINTLK